MSKGIALYVGGCQATYHRIEPTIAPVTSALEALGLVVQVSGIYHKDGGDAWLGDYSSISEATLKSATVVVLFTTGKDTQGADLDAMIQWVRGGGALVGIHCAADSFTDNAEYVSFIGAKFRTHPAQLDIALEVVDAEHPIMQGTSSFTVHDELYLFDDYVAERVHLLAQTRSFDDGDNGPIPLAWTREEGTGRVFYLSLGHNSSTMEDENWQRLFHAGVTWAINA